MRTVELRIVATGLLFLFTLVSGVWLSNSGKPLNTAIITVHKLIALATVIFTVIVIRDLLKNTPVQVVIVSLIVLAGLSALTVFATGALLSLGKPVNAIILTIHAVTPFLLVISTAVIIYLLSSTRWQGLVS
jgi:hypothetical protein